MIEIVKYIKVFYYVDEVNNTAFVLMLRLSMSNSWGCKDSLCLFRNCAIRTIWQRGAHSLQLWPSASPSRTAVIELV